MKNISVNTTPTPKDHPMPIIKSTALFITEIAVLAMVIGLVAMVAI